MLLLQTIAELGMNNVFCENCRHSLGCAAASAQEQHAPPSLTVIVGIALQALNVIRTTSNFVFKSISCLQQTLCCSHRKQIAPSWQFNSCLLHLVCHTHALVLQKACLAFALSLHTFRRAAADLPGVQSLNRLLV